MKEYYYLQGKERLGPFSLEELRGKNLRPQTLTWDEVTASWLPAVQLPELALGFRQENSLLPVVYQKVMPIKKPEPKTPSMSSYLKQYKWIFGWIALHIFALLLAYKEFKLFNTTGEPKMEKFWPFVNFTNPLFDPARNKTYVQFNGFFTQYDLTEFIFYTGIAIFLVVLRIVYKKSSL